MVKALFDPNTLKVFYDPISKKVQVGPPNGEPGVIPKLPSADFCACSAPTNGCPDCWPVNETPARLLVAFWGVRDCETGELIDEINTVHCLIGSGGPWTYVFGGSLVYDGKAIGISYWPYRPPVGPVPAYSHLFIKDGQALHYFRGIVRGSLPPYPPICTRYFTNKVDCIVDNDAEAHNGSGAVFQHCDLGVPVCSESFGPDCLSCFPAGHSPQELLCVFVDVKKCSDDAFADGLHNNQYCLAQQVGNPCSYKANITVEGISCRVTANIAQGILTVEEISSGAEWFYVNKESCSGQYSNSHIKADCSSAIKGYGGVAALLSPVDP